VIERIDAVRGEDVAELARSLFDPATLSVSGVGPDEDVFRIALEPLRAQVARSEDEGVSAGAGRR